MKKAKSWIILMAAVTVLGSPLAMRGVQAKELEDTTSPVLTGVERMEKGPFGTDSSITYKINRVRARCRYSNKSYRAKTR